MASFHLLVELSLFPDTSLMFGVYQNVCSLEKKNFLVPVIRVFLLGLSKCTLLFAPRVLSSLIRIINKHTKYTLLFTCVR